MLVTPRHFRSGDRIEIGVAQSAGKQRLALQARVAAAVFSKALVNHLTGRLFNRGESAGDDARAEPRLLFEGKGNLHGSLYHKSLGLVMG
jgi:hypothetical protein